MLRSCIACVIISFIALGCGGRRNSGVPNSLPPAARTILEQAKQFDLYSLDPEPSQNPVTNGFHGWKTLGKTIVTNESTRRKLVTAFEKGIDRVSRLERRLATLDVGNSNGLPAR